ncbi:hypothetical protein GA0074692_6788 [Micromonospora pallida]|uniref:Uncharacterized protein n=1 Tax=Micromonospora pallida TaxID=145854 RepID=A0A1C6TNS4_9ACTN|nr:hypothetical protein GA0074692_6788 [Micromonospora pallida]
MDTRLTAPGTSGSAPASPAATPTPSRGVPLRRPGGHRPASVHGGVVVAGRWDISGTDVWTPIQAAGILRRLGQGAKPLDSALYRRLPRTNPTAYWPLEDPAGSSSARSAVAGVPNMTVFGYSRFQVPGTGGQPARPPGCPGSPPARTSRVRPGAGLVGRWRAGRPAAGARSGYAVVAGGARRRVSARPGRQRYFLLRLDDQRWPVHAVESVGHGDPAVRVRRRSGDDHQRVPDPVGRHQFVRWIAALHRDRGQDGGRPARRPPLHRRVGVRLDRDALRAEPGASARLGHRRHPNVKEWTAESAGNIEGMPQMGHLAVWQPSAPISGHVEAMRAHAGETAADRIARLCAEQGIPVAVTRGRTRRRRWARSGPSPFWTSYGSARTPTEVSSARPASRSP